MKPKPLRLLWLSLVCLLVPLLWSGADKPAPVAAEVQGGTTLTTLVSAGAATYALGAPRIIWHTPSDCSAPPNAADAAPNTADAAPAAPEDPERIARTFTYGGLTRILLDRNDPRPPGVCNPYHIYSNVVADSTHIYWADDDGLVRLPVEANVGDTPELVNALIQSTGNGQRVELAQNANYIFAITYPNNSQSTVHRINKSSGLRDVVAAPFSGLAADLQADNQNYAYWRVGTTLRRAYWPLFSYVVETVATGVTGYYADGLRNECNPTCTDVHYVYVAQGNQIRRYNNLNGSLSAAIYTSSSSQEPAVYDMVATNTHLFIFERRDYLPCPGCFIQYNQVILRMGRTGGTAVPLYEHLAGLPVTLDTLNPQNDGSNLYWQEEDRVLKLPNNAEALPQTNLTIARMEVTQGIQTTTHGVNLIAGRRTFVRVFGQAATGSVSGVTAFLYRVNPVNSQPIGDPLVPVNATGTHLAVSSAPAPELLDGGFLFELPMSWVDPALPILKLKAVINPYNTPLESNPNDNTLFSPTFTLQPSPRLEVDFYIIGYTDANNVTHFPNGITDVQQTFSWIRRTYPVANAPGYLPRSAPGFQPNVHYTFMDQIIPRLNGTHPDCDDLDDDEKSFCATNYIMAQLDAWQERDYDEEENPVYHIKYGMFDTFAGFNRGRGRGGTTLFGYLYGFAVGPSGASCCGADWDTDGAFTDWYTAHELGHALQRGHPGTGTYCGHVASDNNYPYSGSRIGPDNGSRWAFNAGEAYFNAPRQVGTSKPGNYADWHDMMGYCDLQWPSDYTYAGLSDTIWDWHPYALGQSRQPRPAAADDVLRIYGTLLPNSQTAQFHYLRREAEGIPTMNNSGEFVARLLDEQNQVLAEQYLATEAGDDGFSGYSFSVTMPFAAGADRIQIVKLAGDEVWAEQMVSANAPQVSDVHLVSATSPVTGTVTVQWTAVDADNDPLTFDLLYSQDGGSHFEPLRIGISGSSAQMDANLIGGGSTILRVIASDGVLLGTADSAPITIAAKPPQPIILNPADGTTITWGQLVNFTGEALDVQDNSVSPDNMVWSNQYGVLGTGGILSVTDLPVGINEITLTATNSAGLSASANIIVIVKDDGQLPGPTLAVGPSPIGWHVAPGETALQQVNLLLVNLGSGSITWTASSDAAWLTLSASSGSVPGSVTVTGSPDGMVDGDIRQATLTIIGAPDDDGPLQTITMPVTLKMGDTWGDYDPPGWQLYLPTILR